jgi:hypothetical protein
VVFKPPNNFQGIFFTAENKWKKRFSKKTAEEIYPPTQMGKKLLYPPPCYNLQAGHFNAMKEV